MTTSSNEYFSKTIEKGLQILSLFDQSNTRRSLTEISNILEINKTSIYRYINTLTQLGYLKKASGTKILKLGPKALLLGYQFLQGFEFLQTVKPLIDQTYKEYNITIDSVLLDGDALIALYRRESKNTINFRHPFLSKSLYARATGKAVLAFMGEKDFSEFIANTELEAKTKNTIVNVDDLLAELELTRKRGYSLANEEYLYGMNAIGAPIKNIKKDKAVGAVSFDFPAIENPISEIEQKYADSIRKLAMDLSEMITIMAD